MLGFLFYEWVGFLPGGLVVPGYIALYWDRPYLIVAVFTIALLTYGSVRLLSEVMILYSRRRFVLMVITGFVFQWLFELLVIQTHFMRVEVDTIGYIIPGLIANEMDRQGIIPTLSILTILSVLVRLILIVTGVLRTW